MPRTLSPVGVGTRAPDFQITTGGGSDVRLRDLRGTPVILVFSPRAWSPSRGDELAHFNALVAQVPGVNAELIGITRDDMWADLAFADEAVRVPMFSDLDPRGSVADQFDVDEQAVVVIDGNGVVCWRHDGPAPQASELVAALTALAPRPADPDSPRGIELAGQPRCAIAAAHEVEFGFPVRPNRREFVTTALAAAVVLAVMPAVSRAEPVAAALAAPRPAVGATTSVSLNVNGRTIALELEPRVTLLDALREYAGLTATKKGCDHGQCGACTVHVNGRRQLSCLTFAIMHQGDTITTLEGLAQGDQLSPMQAAFIEHDGFQCGYCTPGQIMSATALLK